MSRRPRIIIHIGATKTGSTALQRTLYQKRQALKASGVLYSNLGIASWAHHLVAAGLHPTAWMMHAADLPRDRTAFSCAMVEAMIREAAENDCHTVVLSSEYFWGSLPGEMYRYLEKATRGLDRLVVAFVRDIDEWVASSYLQALKSGYCGSVFEYVRDTVTNHPETLDVLQLLESWARALDARVISLPYRGKAGDLAEAFGTVIGVHSLTMQDDKVVNRSPSRSAVVDLLRVNGQAQDSADAQAERRSIFAADVGATARFGLPISLRNAIPVVYRQNVSALLACDGLPLTASRIRRLRYPGLRPFTPRVRPQETADFGGWFEPIPLHRGGCGLCAVVHTACPNAAGT